MRARHMFLKERERYADLSLLSHYPHSSLKLFFIVLFFLWSSFVVLPQRSQVFLLQEVTLLQMLIKLDH